MNRQLKKILAENCKSLESSASNFSSIYDIMFSQSGICAEDSNGFRIRTYTYQQMRERIEEASCALYNKTGAAHGFIALDMENCAEWIVAFWAILRSGNKPYLVNCRHPHALANSALKRLGIKYILGKGSTKLDGEFIDIANLKTDLRFPGEFEDEIALSTSATSLKEVICFYKGERLCSQILNVKSFIYKYPEIAAQHKGKIKNLAFLPFYHVFGLIAVYFWFSFFGQTIVFLKDYSPDTILKSCKKHEVTHLFSVPLLWHTIENTVNKKVLEKGEKKVKKLQKGLKICTAIQNIFPHLGLSLSQKIMHEVTDELFGRSIKFTISGGSYIRNSALEFFNAIGYNLHNGYGMTEIGITSVDLRTRPKHKNLNSIGKPFDSIEYKLDSEGVLLVKGNSICSKLWIEGENIPSDGWFYTGDCMTEVSGYYYINGRKGDMIIGENGENINPDETERHFSSVFSETENACILGIKNGEAREEVSMVVQLSKYMTASKRNLLLDKIYTINNTLPTASKVQKFFYTHDAIASAGAVKVSRMYLLRAISRGDVNLIDYKKCSVKSDYEVQYSEELLKKVCEIVASVLEVDPSSLDKHAHVMHDLGADSMKYFAILSALADEFSITASESDKDDMRYTIDDFCQYIERKL